MGTTNVHRSEESSQEDLNEKYMNMDEQDFMKEYRYCMGDEIVVEGVTERLTIDEMMAHVGQWTSEEQADEMFKEYVPEEVINDLFIEFNGKENLVLQLVDMIMDGDWTPEN